MRRAHAAVIVMAPFLALGGCGGGGESPTSAMPSGPRAIVTVSQTSVGLIGLSSRPEYLLHLQLPVEIRETSGVAVAMNYVRLRLFRGQEEIERAEVTADDFAGLAGTNRVEAGGTLTITLDFFFNSTDFDNGSILVGGIDANGHSIEFALLALEIEASEGVLGGQQGQV